MTQYPVIKSTRTRTLYDCAGCSVPRSNTSRHHLPCGRCGKAPGVTTREIIEELWVCTDCGMDTEAPGISCDHEESCPRYDWDEHRRREAEDEELED